jgi:hypothetical protein
MILNLSFYYGLKLGLSHYGKDIDWGYLRTGCWGEYLELRGRQ